MLEHLTVVKSPANWEVKESKSHCLLVFCIADATTTRMMFTVYYCRRSSFTSPGADFAIHVLGETDFHNRGGVHFFVGSCTCIRHV